MKNKILFIVLLILLICFFSIEMRYGKYPITANDLYSYLFGSDLGVKEKIILHSRFLRAATALIGGASLALAGLLMQTYFRNALAGPSVLGLSSGSSLAVAIFTMSAYGGSVSTLSLSLGMSFVAFIGSFAVLFLIVFLSKIVRNTVSLLILGLMIGYLTSAAIGVLQFNSADIALKAFVIWGLGSFANTDQNGLYSLIIAFILSLGLLAALYRNLNVLLLGEDYASSLGVNVKRTKLMMIIITGILVGTVTAFCGPISFLGLAVPHLARGMFKTSNHKILVPSVLLIGSGLGIACDIISKSPWHDGGLPLNTITSLIGAPVVIFYLIRKNRMGEMV